MEIIKAIAFAWCCLAVVGEFENLACDKPPMIKMKKRKEDNEETKALAERLGPFLGL